MDRQALPKLNCWNEARVQETNLLEWEDMGGLLTSPLTLKFKPFEIRTFKIRSGLRQGPS